jgi:hypothetical protein
MDEIMNTPQSLGTDQATALKPYQKPTLTPLGSIHSLVRTGPGSGADGGLGKNSAS